jgi:hypothetical protein
MTHKPVEAWEQVCMGEASEVVFNTNVFICIGNT